MNSIAELLGGEYGNDRAFLRARAAWCRGR